MGFELKYPDHTSFTTYWIPSRKPSIDGASFPYNGGYQNQIASNQKTIKAYKYSDPFETMIFPFNKLTADEKADFKTFQLAVGGEAFEVIDVQSDGCGLLLAWTKVKFLDYEFEFVPQNGGKWGVVIPLRESN